MMGPKTPGDQNEILAGAGRQPARYGAPGDTPRSRRVEAEESLRSGPTRGATDRMDGREGRPRAERRVWASGGRDVRG